MKILDRYVLVSFLKNYLISFMVLIGLYIVLDMVFNFDELAEYRGASNTGGVSSVLTMLTAIGDYYFFQVFRIFAHLSGIIPVVAAAFTLIRLTRFNELTAQLAAGVPLTRVAAPIVFASVVLTALLFVDQEVIIPRIIPKLTRKHDELYDSGARTFPIRAMQDDKNGLLNAGRYHPATDTKPPWMEQMDLVQVDEAFAPVSHLVADRAEWDARNKVWRLTNGRVVTGLKPDPNSPASRPSARAVSLYSSSITPDEIALYRSGEFVEFLPRSRISMLLERPKSYGTVDLQRVRHSRITTLIMNVVLVLLAVPCLMSREPGKIKQGIAACVFLCAACLSAIFLCYQLAGTPPGGAEWADKWPAIMTSVPIFIFGPLATFLWDRAYRLKS